MFKNNKAVTLLSLVITIIVILILAGTTIVTSDVLIENTKRKTIVSNMYLIKGEVESIYEEYQFSDNESVLIGEKVTDVTDYGVEIEDTDLWYRWNKDVLSNLGLPDNTEYIVNYATGEIIYPIGVKSEGDGKNYTLTDILENSNNEGA